MHNQIILNHGNEILHILSDLLVDTDSVSLVTFPDHWNVGDSAIWYASCLVLEKLGIKINYVCDYRTYSKADLSKYNPNNPILICGGGNFGNIYPNEEGLRESILNDFPDRKVIQLPQSIRFTSEGAGGKVSALVNSHTNFHLLVRETPSLQTARQLFTCPTALCPDMALVLGPELLTKKKVRRTYTILKRNDGESKDKNDIHKLIGASDHLYDWMQETAHYRWRHWDLKGLLAYALVRLWISSYQKDTFKVIPMTIAIKATRELAKARTLGGLDIIDDSNFVITDRLHAGIMASLGEHKTVLVDNAYHKNRSVYEAWFSKYPYLKIAANFNEAINITKEWHK